MKILKKARSQVPIRYDSVGPVYHENEKGRAVCGARLRGRPEQRCMSVYRRSPNGRCRYHGGGPNVGRPVSSGLWSREMPGYLRDAYERSLLDPDIGNMKDSIALMDAFIAQYLDGLLKTPPVETLETVAGMLELDIPLLVEECEDVPEELEAKIKKCAELLRLVGKNRSEEQEVRRAVRERSELVKTEAMRVEKSSRYLTVDQAMALVAALATYVNQYVTKESERLQLARAIDRLIGKGTVEEYRSPGDREEETPRLPSASSTETVTARYGPVVDTTEGNN